MMNADLQRRRLTGALVTVAVGTLAATSSAAVWTGGSGNWSSDGSPGWNGTGVPNGTGAVVEFDGTAGTTTQDIEGGVVVGTISFVGTSGGTRQIAPGEGLTLNQDGAGPGHATISNSNSGSGAVRLQLNATGAAVTLADDVLITSTSNSTGSFAISITSGIAGTGNMTLSNVSNAVPIHLNANNSFVGSVLVEKGLVTLGNAGFGPETNAVTLGKAAAGPASLITTGSSTTLRNNITVAAGTGGPMLLGSNHTGTTTSTFTGAITLNGDLIITSSKDTSAANGKVAFTGPITGTGSLTKTGAGVVEFSAANTYTGDTTITQGKLALTSASEMRFQLDDADANQLKGTGILAADGLFVIDASALTVSAGTWNLVMTDTLDVTFGDNFNLQFAGGAAFTPNEARDTFTSGDWVFTIGDGNLVLVPEPGMASLVGIAGLGLLRRRR